MLLPYQPMSVARLSGIRNGRDSFEVIPRINFDGGCFAGLSAIGVHYLLGSMNPRAHRQRVARGYRACF